MEAESTQYNPAMAALTGRSHIARMPSRPLYRSPEPSDSEDDSRSVSDGSDNGDSHSEYTDPDTDVESECDQFERDMRQQSISTQDSIQEMLSRMSPDLRMKHTKGRSARASDVHLPLQQKYTGDAPVISSRLASKWCEDLGVDGMLDELNRILNTNYTFKTSGLETQLTICIELDLDFGQAYGRLRPYWTEPKGFPYLSKKLRERGSKDQAMRREAYDVEASRVRASTPPRRVWDLYSNRVLPWWLIRASKDDVWAVSHSWVHEDDRYYAESRVNGGEWPVPLPDELDDNLESVRTELLNYGAEYAWLDVLCLRQKDPAWKARGSSEEVARKEKLRKKECKTDVPTIGYVYEGQETIITYFSGLGRPFRAAKLHDERHWLHRAWTLQEIHHNPMIGGLTAIQHLDDFRKNRRPKKEHDDDDEDKFFEALAEEIAFIGNTFDVFAVLHRMRMRDAICELDKVGGIAYLLKSHSKRYLPTYDPDEDPENAWKRLVRIIDYQFRAELFFLFPSQGKSARWMPSWQQTQGRGTLPNPGRLGINLPGNKDEYIVYDHGQYRFAGLRIQKCRIEGLERRAKRCREGRLVVRVDRHRVKRLAVKAHHQEPIPERKEYSYDLLGTHDQHYWVVGTMTRDGSFKKVSVLRIEDEDALRTITESGLAEQTSVNLE